MSYHMAGDTLAVYALVALALAGWKPEIKALMRWLWREANALLDWLVFAVFVVVDRSLDWLAGDADPEPIVIRGEDVKGVDIILDIAAPDVAVSGNRDPRNGGWYDMATGDYIAEDEPSCEVDVESRTIREHRPPRPKRKRRKPAGGK